MGDQGSKPWRYSGKEENMDREEIKMLVKKWWEIYNDESVDYKGTNIPNRVGETDKYAVLVEAGGVNYIVAPSSA